MNYQICTDLLDGDDYKLKEWYYKWIYHRDVTTRWESFNRTKQVRTAEIIPREAMIEQLEASRKLSFTEVQLGFIHGQSREYFSKDTLGWIDYLRNFRLPEYELVEQDGNHKLIVEHPDALYWEIPWLYTESELLLGFRSKRAGVTLQEIECEAERVFLGKIDTLKMLPAKSLLEFATRRRASKRIQRRLYKLAQELIGDIMTATSNPALGMETGTPWTGTHPHAGILLEMGILLALEYTEESVRGSQNEFFRKWWDLFPYPVRVALTDTLGKIFWQDFDPELAKAGRGLRWDSGPWKEFVHEAWEYYQRIKVDPRDPLNGKDGFFSDGLDPLTMVEIYTYAKDFFRQVLFGWGTNFSNDLGKFKDLGFTPISSVFKPTKIGDIDVAKLSNNPAKATGKPETVEFLKKATHYNPDQYLRVQPTY